MLETRGWVTFPFGAGQLTEEARRQLIKYDTPMRYIPDILAFREDRLVLVEAKTGRNDTDNVAIETKCYEAGFSLSGIWRIPVFYVWCGFLTGDVWTIHEHKHAGPYRGDGSGTPFYLVPKKVLKLFDDVFGTAKE
jgi:hypothetical protein